MDDISLSVGLFLAAAAFLAGFMDAVVGGGGLVQLPALLSSLPGHSTAVVLGTNKVSSLAGTTMAAWRYIRSVELVWRLVLPIMLVAGLASWVGAHAVSLVSREQAQPVILVVLVAVAIFTFRRKEFGLHHAPRRSLWTQLLLGMLGAAVLGFYDGALGPGTGAFLIFFFVRVFGYDFLHASAASKAVNWVTNAAALGFFLPSGHVLVVLGLIMAACNVVGALIGTRLAVVRGSGFVRRLFLLVLCFMIARMAWATWESI
jgi:uncharacterized membrane protein YfcA